jgi:4-amino-4-deoxy-L-arabinose transferase-like glycosyltransferase
MRRRDAATDACRRRWPTLALGALLLVYVGFALDGLTRVPGAQGDEMWNAAPAYKLASVGIYGSDAFAGFHRADVRTYQFMPVLQLLEAAVFKIFDVGLLQIRLLSVAIGGIVVLSTYLIGRGAGDARVGVLAVLLLVSYRLGTGSLETGVVFIDIVRVTRYHVLVPAFGLAALLAFNRAEGRRAPAAYALAGALSGLAFLSHMYGAFWLAALAATMTVRRGPRALMSRELAVMVAGFGLVCVPWGAYVVRDLEAYRGQMSMYRDRFGLLDPGFYLANVRQEIWRYAGFGVRDLATWRPGAWVALVAFPAALVVAGRDALRRREAPLCAVVVSLLVIVGLYALLLRWKTFSYLLTPLTLVVVVAAYGAIRLWDSLRAPSVRLLLLALLTLTMGEATAEMVARHRRAEAATTYEQIVGRIASHVPPRATVVAPLRYWLGLRDRTFRGWPLALLLTDRGSDAPPRTVADVLRDIAPDVIIFDDHEFGRTLADPAHPSHWQYVSIMRYVEERHAVKRADLSDPTYGSIQIFLLNGEGPPPRDR